MKNLEKSFGREVAEKTVVGAMMFGLAGSVVKVSDSRDERRNLAELQVLDEAEARLKARAEKRQEELKTTTPQADQIIGQCQSKLNRCLAGVHLPMDKACQNVMVDVHSFHQSVAKPRKSNMFLNATPDVYACDIPIQADINRCYEQVVSCLEQ